MKLPDARKQELQAWLADPGKPDADGVRTKLREWLPEYRPGGPDSVV